MPGPIDRAVLVAVGINVRPRAVLLPIRISIPRPVAEAEAVVAIRGRSENRTAVVVRALLGALRAVGK